MLVNEIFQSIQGEIPTGKNTVFVRLAGCNIRCTEKEVGFNCDSQYAYDGKEMSVEDVIKKIKKYNSNYIVFTGGEPCLQIDEIKKIIEKINKKNNYYFFGLETNGTIDIKYYELFEYICISPKKNYIDLDVLGKNGSYENVYFKFVVDNESSFKYIISVIDKLKINYDDVWLMPEGIEKEKIEKNSLWLIKKCLKHGFNFAPRLHIMLYDNKRKR